MNLDELQSVQSKERRNDTLQHLRDSFYDDVGEYVADLKNRRDLAADRADDPFGSPEVRRLTDEIETAEEVVEKVYERRMGKLVKQASLAAAGMNADTEGMTVQERDLFDDIVAAIQENKADVLATLSGEAVESPEASEPDPATAGTAESDVSAADMMADDGPAADAGRSPASDPTPARADPGGSDPDPVDPARAAPDPDGDAGDVTPVDPADDPLATAPGDGAVGGGDDTLDGDAEEADRPHSEARAVIGDDGDERTDGGAVGDAAAPADPPEATVGAGVDGGSGGANDDTERSTVRITDDVGQIFGVDGREYDLERSDVVTLPEQNAEPLLDQDAAERLD